MSFRDNLLYLRDSRNMTQEHLAMLLGVTRQAVSKGRPVPPPPIWTSWFACARSSRSTSTR